MAKIQSVKYYQKRVLVTISLDYDEIRETGYNARYFMNKGLTILTPVLKKIFEEKGVYD